MLLTPTRKYVKKHALSIPASSVKIVRACLGTKAGIMGAAGLCL